MVARSEGFERKKSMAVDFLREGMTLLLNTISLLIATLAILVLASPVNMGAVANAAISTVCVVVYCCCFVMGFGPMPNILCAEIFPTRVRGLCIAVPETKGMPLGVSTEFFSVGAKQAAASKNN
ncbi:hypothetical protein Vadar_010988 [Vaccinium darrowii]|uniref:Uncharacterized protein n=1 Tax=Vaccinium darrowii TaxID=229202 RepID=A0ACB7YCY7_9ERIC|nr:hypothetical protein Vadar_010988 [Vaccinium darrowii]